MKTIKCSYVYVICIALFVGSVYSDLCSTCLIVGPDFVGNLLTKLQKHINVDQISFSHVEGRGKKKKKIKSTSMNIMIGGSMMAAFMVIIMFLNMITVTLGKTFLFTLITKFLIFINWIPSSYSSTKKKPHKNVTLLMA